MNGKTYTCPTHGTRLDGGPIRYWYDLGRHGVPAADLSHEFTPRPTATVPAPAGATSGGGR